MSDSTKETEPVDNLSDYYLPKNSVAYSYTEAAGTNPMDGSDDSVQGFPLSVQYFILRPFLASHPAQSAC